MEPLHRQKTTIWPQLLLFVIVLLSTSVERVQCGCRMQDRNPCETVCQRNSTRNGYDCTLRVIVILPKKDTVEASLPRVINFLHIISAQLLSRHRFFSLPKRIPNVSIKKITIFTHSSHIDRGISFEFCIQTNFIIPS